jgi:hypothetical protein
MRIESYPPRRRDNNHDGTIACNPYLRFHPLDGPCGVRANSDARAYNADEYTSDAHTCNADEYTVKRLPFERHA